MATVPNNVTEIQPVSHPPDSLVVVRNPNLVLKEALKAAEALKKVIDAKPNKVRFNGETYLENEDWLTIARFYGVTSRIRSTRYVSYGEGEYSVRGFEAVAEAFLVERDQVVSMAESMCLSDEGNWKSKPLFQLRSMAQTRASSRVLRQVLGWVVVLAGYKPTPAEEMNGGAGPTLALGLCYDCGEDIFVQSEIEASRNRFGQKLCRVCFKTKLRTEAAGADRNLEPELRKSVEHAQGRRGQPITRVIDQGRDDLAGD